MKLSLFHPCFPNSQPADSQFGPPLFLFRPMREEDVPEVMKIERRSFPTPWPESAYRHELRYGTDSLFFVLQLQKESPPETWQKRVKLQRPSLRILGYVGMRLLPGEAHITTIAVHPDWRGRGLGKYILLMAIERALTHRVHSITLEVRASNRVAQNLYADVGFQFVGVHPHYYRDGENALLMRLGPLDEGQILHLQELRRMAEERLRGLHPLTTPRPHEKGGDNDGTGPNCR